VYHDTRDRRLLRIGITLRRRLENGDDVWQLKLPSGDGRRELEARSQAEELAPALARLLSGVLHDRALEPFATMVTRRRGVLVDGVEVTVDEVEVLDEHAVSRCFTEIEAELVDGPPERLQRIGEQLERLGARPTSGKPKVVRAVGEPDAASDGGKGTLGMLRRALGAQVDELLRHDPAVRLGNDPEDVHKMRVAVRRLRSILRVTKPLLDANWVDAVRAELDWLGDSLGAVRDADVLSDSLHTDAAKLNSGDAVVAAELLRPIATERAEAHEELTRALGDERYYRLLEMLDSARIETSIRRDHRTIEQLAAKEYRRLRKRGALSRSMSNAALHKRRIRIKRVRYAAELAVPSHGRGAKKLVSAAKSLQDILGEHQDAVVARRRLRRLARGSATHDAALVAGRLIERQEQRMDRARSELAKGWRKLRRRGDRAWSR
jgi:CHAD domain-containing protein